MPDPIRIEPSVHWREGLFLTPQHLQAFARELNARIFLGDSVATPGAHGVVELDVDREALGRDQFAIRAGAVVLPDGSFLSIPGTTEVEPRDFGRFFEQRTLDVFLGIRSADVPVAEGDNGRTPRFRTFERAVFDENRVDADRPVEFRRLQARLFFGNEDRAGFESLRISRLAREGRPEVVTVLDTEHVPTVLRIGASDVLTQRLSVLAERLRAEARDLSRRVPALGSLTSVDRATDIAALIKLQAINEGLVEAEQLDRQPELHPHEAYRTLVRMCGLLAILSDDRIPPRLPAYDHDDLTGCFGPVLELLDDLVPRGVVVPYEYVDLTKDPLFTGRYECAVPDSWSATSQRRLFLGIEIDQNPEELAPRVQDLVRIYAPSREERTLGGATPDVEVHYAQHPPTSFPRRDGLHYFRIATDGSSRDGWEAILAERRLLLFVPLGSLSDAGSDDAAVFSIFVELA